jgi:hypothetical protein
MRKAEFLVILGSVLVVFSLACKKSEKAPSSEAPQATIPEAVQEAAQAAASPLLFSLDGSLKDWAGIVPLWNEGGAAGQGTFESNVDIKQVYFKNDAQYLYVFMQTVPSIEERFKISKTGDILGDLYIDTDNDPNSGSGAVGGFEAEKCRGYEMRIYLPIGVMSYPESKIPYVAYEVRPLEGVDFSANATVRWESFSEGSLIAHGPEGVEFAIPLESCGLTLPATVRLLLAERSHWSEEQGYTVGQLTLGPRE